mgnify:CR=1 FL=1
MGLFQKAVESKGETLGRAPQSSKSFCLPKIRTELPVDVPPVGDPIRGSPERRQCRLFMLNRGKKYE